MQVKRKGERQGPTDRPSVHQQRQQQQTIIRKERHTNTRANAIRSHYLRTAKLKERQDERASDSHVEEKKRRVEVK
jgi:hypothetical protein